MLRSTTGLDSWPVLWFESRLSKVEPSQTHVKLHKGHIMCHVLGSLWIFCYCTFNASPKIPCNSLVLYQQMLTIIAASLSKVSKLSILVKIHTRRGTPLHSVVKWGQGSCNWQTIQVWGYLCKLQHRHSVDCAQSWRPMKLHSIILTVIYISAWHHWRSAEYVFSEDF